MKSLKIHEKKFWKTYSLGFISRFNFSPPPLVMRIGNCLAINRNFIHTKRVEEQKKNNNARVWHTRERAKWKQITTTSVLIKIEFLLGVHERRGGFAVHTSGPARRSTRPRSRHPTIMGSWYKNQRFYVGSTLTLPLVSLAFRRVCHLRCQSCSTIYDMGLGR